MPATNEEFIKKAFEAGLTESQVRAAVAERNQLKPSVQETPAAETATNDSFLTSMAKGAVKGALNLSPIGSVVSNAKTILKASELPSNFVGGALRAGQEETGMQTLPKLSTTIKGGIQGVKESLQDNPNRPTVMEQLPTNLGIDPKSGTGMAVGLAGEILTPDISDLVTTGKIGKEVAEKASKNLTQIGEDLATKSIKPSPSQLTKFEKMNKISFGKALSEEGLVGDTATKLAEKLKNEQEQFTKIAAESGVKINQDTINQTAQDVVSQMNKYVDKKEMGAITDFARELAQDAKKGIDISIIDKTRKALAEKIPQGDWAKLIAGDGMSEKVAQYGFLINLQRKATEGITSESGKTLKELGKHLSKLYNIEDIVTKQANLGKGAQLFGLTDLVALTAGVAGGTTPVGKVLSGIGSALVKRAVNAPATSATGAKAAFSAAQGVTQIPQAAINVATKIAKEPVIQGAEQAAVSSTKPIKKVAPLSSNTPVWSALTRKTLPSVSTEVK